MNSMKSTISKSDAIIIVPPFAGIERASLGAHILQSCAALEGFEVVVSYANIQFANLIGIDTYNAITNSPFSLLVGERIFSQSAFDIQAIDYIIANYDRFSSPESPRYNIEKFKKWLPELKRVEKCAIHFAVDYGKWIAKSGVKLIGSTSTFQQVASSVALLRQVKENNPDVITMIGGANCDGQMADGVLSLSSYVDYVFSGESEEVFVEFLKNARHGNLPDERIIHGSPVQQMDNIPIVEYAEFYEQFDRHLPKEKKDLLPLIYETSRGCWWGQKHHCTFCGFIGSGMAFREKSASKVISELKILLSKHPNSKVTTTDSIMPFRYFKTLLPRIPEELPKIELFYEQKANLSLKQLEILKQAGTTAIQPGIEALSSELLTKIKKGNTAVQNIDLLRHSRMIGIFLEWILIYGFPDDRLTDYPVSLIPLLRHFYPPVGPIKLSIDRFSPYFNEPHVFGIEHMRPIDSYKHVFPQHSKLDDLAFYFKGEYRSESLEAPSHTKAFSDEVEIWRKMWEENQNPPDLTMTKLSADLYMIYDSRRITASPELQNVNRSEAEFLTKSHRIEQVSSEAVEKLINKRLAVCVDDWFIPLVVPSRELLAELTE